MHLNPPNTCTLFPESPSAVSGSASSLVASGLPPKQGEFLFSDDYIVNWFDTQTEDTLRFWMDRAVELFSLPDSASPRQCWAAFCAFATGGVRALPVLTTHAAVIRKHGQPRFVAYLPPGMMRWRDNGGVMPFWSVTAFDAFIACLRGHGYRVTFPSLCVASVLPPVRGAAS